MTVTESEKILLYRIDEQAKNVIFIITEDNEEAWKNITDDMQTILSFDETYRKIKAFDFNLDDDLKAFKRDFQRIIIRGGGRNDIYTIADKNSLQCCLFDE